MRSALVAFTVLIASCAQAQPLPQSGEPRPLWRMDTRHLANDRARIRECLDAGQGGCEEIVQVGCRDPETESAAAERICDWRAIAAWEDEMEVTLAALRRRVSGSNLANLEASQRAWNASMLADVGFGMDLYEGGSLAGVVGAHIRAHSTARHVIYLEEVRQPLEE